MKKGEHSESWSKTYRVPSNDAALWKALTHLLLRPLGPQVFILCLAAGGIQDRGKIQSILANHVGKGSPLPLATQRKDIIKPKYPLSIEMSAFSANGDGECFT
jgi:hypothetical protein